MTEHAKHMQEMLAKLKTLFPDDERLRNAALMASGVCDQLPLLNEALKHQINDLPAPGISTIEWENLLHLAVGDAIRWITNLELALHDLRAALFYRYNNRIKSMKPPSEEEYAEAEAHREANRTVAREAIASEKAKKEASTPKPEKDDKAAKNIANLFRNIAPGR